ncbi:acetylornithine transaminase [Stomatohabitans albus]|uniref:acetylornithine transaminase n=1 Tax=Stomatohabitans albus TaxID=3110766 RepID=UPI00300D7580
MDSDVLMPTYGQPPITAISGNGCWLTTETGETLLDGYAGIAVSSLGHAHPAMVTAVSEQVRTLAHVSNLIGSEPALALAAKLNAISGWKDGRTFFCNSGTEANEAALKLAHRYGTMRDPKKRHVVSLKNAFHGRTRGSLRITSHSPKTDAFEPLGDWNTQVSDAAELREAVTDSTCAVILEVIQGEGGVVPVDEHLLQTAREQCDHYDALLIIDEVQTGIGRTGAWFGFQTTSVEPDVITLAKGLGGGIPIGAVVAHGKAATAFHHGDHGSTFGGNLVACAAALAVITTIEQEGLLAHVLDMERVLCAGLDAIVADHDLAMSHRGRGLLHALVLSDDVAESVVMRAINHGLLVNNVRPNAIRIAPALTITEHEVTQLLERLGACL